MQSQHKPQQPSAQSTRPAGAAQLLSIGESTLWRWAKERADFPRPRRIGPKTTVFDVAELIAWRDAQGGEMKRAVHQYAAKARNET